MSDRRAILLGIGVVAGLGLLLASRPASAGNAAEGDLDEAIEENEPGFFTELMTSGGNIEHAVDLPNVVAFRDMLASFEGGVQGCNALYGGGRFEGFADHPRLKVTAGGITSSAAGRYQILARTYDDVAPKLGITDFSPRSQDLIATYLIKRRGALDDVERGNFAAALDKVKHEWASLPGAGYGQGERSFGEALAAYEAAGGQVA